MDRETVGRIVRSDEVRELVETLRDEFYGLGPLAVAAVRHGLQEEKDSRLGYQILSDIGAIPSPQETSVILTKPPLSLSDQARETLLSSLSEQDRKIFTVLRMFSEKSRNYGMPDIDVGIEPTDTRPPTR